MSVPFPGPSSTSWMSCFTPVLRYCDSSHMPKSYASTWWFIIIIAQAKGEVTHLTKCLADLWAGDEVTPSPNHRIRGVHIVAFCGVRQAELHVRPVRHGSINLYVWSKDE